MVAAANTLLLLAGVMFLIGGYRLGWTVNVDARRADWLKRLYYASVVLAFASCLAVGLHVGWLTMYGGGTATVVALVGGVVLVLMALVSVSQGGRQ